MSPLEVLFARMDHSDSTVTYEQRMKILSLLLKVPAEEREAFLLEVLQK